MNRPGRKIASEEVDLPKKYGGRVLVDFDDFEADVIESYQKKENVND